jgi:hypothetical protein
MNRPIVVDAAQEIACPKCSHAFHLSEGISRQTIDGLAEQFEHSQNELRKEMEEGLAVEAKRKAERDAAGQVTELREQVAAAEARALESKAQLERATEAGKAAAREQLDLEMRAMKESLAEKASALEEIKVGELELRRQLREAQDKAGNQEIDYQRKLDEARAEISLQTREQFTAEFGPREAQMKAQMEAAQREVTELKRKLDQGSQQLQGETLELGLEEMLRSAFPLDEIVPVPKGVSGADIVQRVRTPGGQVCGSIIWEAKQTKNWSEGWLQKLKDDQQAAGAELAVLVTSAMPSDAAAPFVRESDVWVTRSSAARSVAEVLRTTLIELHKLRQANTGRNERMELLYNYIHSPQFTQRVNSVVGGINAMRQDLEAEKTAMARMWKKREAQLVRMSSGVLSVVGELQGLEQSGLPQLDSIASLPAAIPDDAVDSHAKAA